MLSKISPRVLGLILLAAAAALGHHYWLGEHDARLKAEAAVAAAQKSFDAASAELRQVKDAQTAKDAAAAAQVAAIAKGAAAQQTPAQIVKWIPANLAALPAPIKATVPAPTAQEPAPAATFVVPAADLTFLRDQVAACQESAVRLSNAQDGLSSCQQQVRLLNGQIADVVSERDALKQELKGGTLWHRVKHDAKVGAGVAAAAVLALCASGHCK
jgi:hypothetical protein